MGIMCMFAMTVMLHRTWLNVMATFCLKKQLHCCFLMELRFSFSKGELLVPVDAVTLLYLGLGFIFATYLKHRCLCNYGLSS